MPTAGPPPLFHGKPVAVTYAPYMRNARIIAAGIAGSVKLAVDRHLTEDELIARLIAMGKSYSCEVRLTGRTPDILEFSVTSVPRLR
jgi:ABC-type uncharacterized transport system permease subunit